MDCDQALALLCARLDGALPAADGPALDAHLAGCAACRASADALREQDAELRRAFAPRRRAAAAVAERVLARLPAKAPAPRPNGRRAWAAMLLSAAAGFLLAVGLFRPWERTPAVQTGPGVVKEQPKEQLRLAVATGPVEALPAGKDAWQAVAGGDSVAVGCRVRTPAGVRCEFQCADGSEVRLNSDSELAVRSGREMTLARGQMLASVKAAPAPFRVTVDDATVTALGTQFDLWRLPGQTTLTVLEGSTRVQGGGGEDVVDKGWAATIVKGQVTAKRQEDDLIQATRWVHEILVLKGRRNEELAQRVDDLFARIGQSKLEFMDEQEIRSLGDHCVLPLTRYLQSNRMADEPDKRHRAARILADLAQPWSIGDLIRLLDDDDAEVRFRAAKGLARLTCGVPTCSPDAWKTMTPDEVAEQRKKWHQWWEEHKDRIPQGP
jgi:ferric-dicitrate binding protein FerR (iron transport regulator)